MTRERLPNRRGSVSFDFQHAGQRNRLRSPCRQRHGDKQEQAWQTFHGLPPRASGGEGRPHPPCTLMMRDFSQTVKWSFHGMGWRRKTFFLPFSLPVSGGGEREDPGR